MPGDGGCLSWGSRHRVWEAAVPGDGGCLSRRLSRRASRPDSSGGGGGGVGGGGGASHPVCGGMGAAGACSPPLQFRPPGVRITTQPLLQGARVPTRRSPAPDTGRRLYSHDHSRVFHDAAAWSELLDGAGRVQRPGPPVTRGAEVTSPIHYVRERGTHSAF